MTNEEKYKLIINYLNKLIDNKKSVRSYQSYDNYGNFGFEEFGDNGYSHVILRVSVMSLSILYSDGSHMLIGLLDHQKTEIKYLFHKLVEISEENCIKYLEVNEQ